MINKLVKHSDTLTLFGKFYRSRYGDITSFIKLSNTHQIGVFIEFLSEQGIGIHADRFSYVLFYSNVELDEVKEKVVTLIKDKKTYFIKEVYYDKPKNLFTNYEDAVIAAFSILETPF